MVKATERSGGARSVSNTTESDSPLAKAATADDIRDQSDKTPLSFLCQALFTGISASKPDQ